MSKIMPEYRIKQRFIIIITAIIVVSLSVGYFFYRIEQNAIRKSHEDFLHSVSELKTDQLVQWLAVRKSDISTISNSYYFKILLSAYLQDRSNPKLIKELSEKFDIDKVSYYYREIILCNNNGEILFPTTKQKQYFSSEALIMETVKTKNTAFSDFYFSDSSRQHLIEFVSPVLENENVIAVLIFVVDAQKFLNYYSKLQLGSDNYENFLVRSRGDSIQYMIDFSDIKSSVQYGRMTITNKNLPSAKVLTGFEGIFEGVDFKGIEVLSYVKKIPGTDWGLVTKIDKSHISRHITSTLILIVLLSTAIIALTGIGILLLFNHREKKTLSEIVSKQSQLLQVREETQAVLYSIGEGVITTDKKGIINGINPAAQKITGWTENECIGQTLEKVFNIVNEDSSETVLPPIARIVQEGQITGFSNHTVLINRHGDTIPISENGAPIKDETGNVRGAVIAFRDQTKERSLLKAITESQKNFRTLFENSPTGKSMTGVDGSLLVNRAFSEITGYSREELKNKKWQEIIHPDDISKTSDIVASLIEGKTTQARLEQRFINKKGEIVWTDVSIFLQRDELGKPEYFITTVIDITQKKADEDALRRSSFELKVRNEIVEVFLSESGDQIYSAVLQIILEAFRSRFGIFGYIDENGDLIVPTMTVEVRDRCNIQDKTVKFEKQTWGDSSLPTAIREKRIVYSNAPSSNITEGHIQINRHISMPIIHMDRVIGLIQIANRETDYIESDLELIEILGKTIAPILDARLGAELEEAKRKEAESQLKILNLDLENRVSKRTEQLEAANKELEAFSYSVSHDLRAPLRHISGYIDLMEKKFAGSLPAKARQYLEIVTDSAAQMGTLIDDLLQFSRTGRVEMHQIKFSLMPMISEIIDQMKTDNAERKIEFIIGNLPEVNGDYNLLRQVLYNLLSNSVKYSAFRDKAIIEINCESGEKEHIFSVRDNGVGFDMAYSHKLFGVFQRLHSSTEFKGTGIGLANVRRIVTRHGGRVWAESELGSGSVFYFTLLIEGGAEK